MRSVGYVNTYSGETSLWALKIN